MRGSSRGAATAAAEALEHALSRSTDWAGMADDLFAVTTLLDGNAALRRAMADPSREGDAKRGLARSLLAGRVREETADVVAEVAGQRWAAEGDLTDTLEHLGASAFLALAEREHRIDAVEDELFRFERIVAADERLRDTLSARNTNSEGKVSLVHGLLAGRAAPETVRLVEQAVRVPRGRRLDRVLTNYLELAGQRREELTALVRVAAPLTAAQSARLRSALERVYGKPVALQIVLEEGVIGGIRVQVGDEVVDGTILRRLEEARRHLAG
ncbi:MAG TPA: F0F1 ATP synthase subunit delta [Dermatophilaceae bacterium]|nr:F0F1 ATP synthase subunit delta [Dermatophilaceae bacterium]